MKTTIVILMVFVTCLSVTQATTNEPPNPILNEISFLKEFSKARETNDKARMEELIRQAGPVVYRVVIGFVMDGIVAKANEKEWTHSFSVAGGFAKMYAKEFKKKIFLKLSGLTSFTRRKCVKKN